MSDVFKKRLIEIQLAVVESYEDALEDAPFEYKKLNSDVLHMQKTILRKLGYRPKTQVSNIQNAAPKDLFKKKSLSKGQVPISEINNNINKDAFNKKNVLDEKPKDLENKNVNHSLFKKDKHSLPSIKEKAHPQRLNQKQIADIKELANKGMNKIEITDKLMIAVKKVEGHLKAMKKKKGGNLITTSNKDKSLEKEVKDFKNGK